MVYANQLLEKQQSGCHALLKDDNVFCRILSVDFFKKICALTIFKQIIYKLSIYFCIWWMISPEYIDSIIKYINAWNLFLAYLYK